MDQPQPLSKRIFSLSILALLLLINTLPTLAQQTRGILKGKVITAKNDPAENVSVTLKGTKFGTITDENGLFEIKAPEGNYTLVITEVGAKGQEKTVSVKAGQTTNLQAITVDNTIHGLQEVNINANKTNKFKRTRSEDVAKMPLANLENPQVYNTISNQLIQEQLIFSVDDALRNAPGLQKMWDATGRGGDGGAYFNSRGFIVQSSMRNGIAGKVTNSVDAANIERIEVIKGPSGTLFGNALTSYGGLINRVTKKPYDTFGGEVSLSGGNFGFYRGSADINTPLDKDKKVLFRLNTAFNHDGSFQNNGFSQNLVIDPSIVYKANDRLTISADAELSYGKNVGKTIYFFPYGLTVEQLGFSSADKSNIDYRQSYHGDGLTQISQNRNFYGEVKYKISNTWISRTNLSYTHSYSDGHGLYYYLLPGDSISRNDQATRNSKDDMFEIQQNFNGDFKIGKFRNRFVGGLDFFRENSKQYFYGSTLDTVSVTGNHNYNNFNGAALDAMYAAGSIGFTYPSMYKRNTYSAYISDVFNITDQLMASAGLRVDRFDNKGNYDPVSQKTSGAYKQTALSPKFGLVYQPVKDHVSLFANYQNSFNNQTGTTENNKPLKPEQANQIEGGVKLDLFDGKLGSTVSYYDIKVKDIVRPSTVNPVLSVQDGTQFSKGFEAEVIANPLPGLNLTAGFIYNNSKLTKTADATIEGLRPATAGSPYQANFWASYKIQQGAVKGLGFGIGGNYASDNKVINSHTLGVFTLPSYTILNASAFYDTNRYRFGAKLDNFTNQKYWVGYGTVNPQKLRSFALSATYKF